MTPNYKPAAVCGGIIHSVIMYLTTKIIKKKNARCMASGIYEESRVIIQDMNEEILTVRHGASV